METQKTQTPQAIKKNGARRIRLPNFRVYYKTVQYWCKTRNVGQWNRIESPSTYGQLIYDIGWKNIQWRKESLFNKWCWENREAAYKRQKLEHSLTSYPQKKNSKWIKGGQTL